MPMPKPPDYGTLKFIVYINPILEAEKQHRPAYSHERFEHTYKQSLRIKEKGGQEKGGPIRNT